jgi:hypothetical protein
MRKNYDKITCNKVPFEAVFRYDRADADVFQNRIKSLVSHGTDLVYHAMNVFKFYILADESYDYAYQETAEIFEVILYLLNNDYRSATKSELIEEIRPLVAEYLDLSAYGKPMLRNVQQLITYLTRTWMTNIRVNVDMNFTKMFLRYVNNRLDFRRRLNSFGADTVGRRAFQTRVRQLKNYLLAQGEKPDALSQLEHDVVSECEWVLPFELSDEETWPEKGVRYDVAVNSLQYLSPYCRLARLYERNEYRLFSAIPLRTGLILKHIPIDTVILCKSVICDSTLLYGGVEDKDAIWNDVFDLSHKAFRSRGGCHFDGMIQTDLTSVSVYLSKEAAKGQAGTKRRRKSKTEKKNESVALYFDNNVEAVVGKNYVVIDPNKRDLLYCQDQGGTILRYTSNMRAVESRSRKYQKMRLEMRQLSGCEALESEIPTHKTMQLGLFVEYLRKRRELDPRLRTFYRDGVFNRLRLHSYINKQRSEQRFINKFKQVYGPDAVVIMGDWSDAGRTPKFQAPSKTKGWRTVFSRNQIANFLIDEYGTSKHCPRCTARVECPYSRISSRPWRAAEGAMEKVHGLLGCNNRQCIQQYTNLPPGTRAVPPGSRYRLWNRDTLATTNMLEIVRSVLNGDGRPARFRRGVNYG